MKSNASNFLENLCALLSKLLFEDWPFFVEQQGPLFFDNGEMMGEKHCCFAVFSPSIFEEKFFFSVARFLDCKLVRYCNIEVFLLVSHFLCVLIVQVWMKT